MNIRLLIIGFVAFLMSTTSLFSQTTLTQGDITVTGVTSDNADSFAFVLWRDIASGTVIRFTDHSINSDGTIRANENDMSFTFNQAITAGSVIRWVDGTGATLNGGTFTTAPTIAGSLSAFSADGDQVFAYQGDAIGTTNSNVAVGSRTFLYGYNVANTNWLTSGTADAQDSYRPTAISSNLNFNFDSTSFDNVDYTGVRTGLTSSFYRAAITNTSTTTNANNFTASNTRFDLTQTAFTVNTSASVFWDSNGDATGDGGTGTWTNSTTVESSNFKAENSLNTTYFRWVNSSSNNAHTAIFAGTAGTVSLGTGGVTASGLRFEVSGYTIQTNTLTFDHAASNTAEVNVVTSGHTATINSVIAGSNNVNKTGSGTLTFGGANTYTGSTTVSAGTLILSSTGSINSSSSIRVLSGASFNVSAVTYSVVNAQRLEGNGTVIGATTINAGGTIRGGFSSTTASEATGTLTVGNTTINGSSGSGGATLAVDLNSASGSTIASNSQLALGSNTLNFVNGTGQKFNISLLNDANLTHSQAYTITIATASSGTNYDLNGNDIGTLDLDDFNLVSGSGTWISFNAVSLSVSGSNLQLTFTPVPEPGTVLASTLVLVGLGGFVRRKLNTRRSDAAETVSQNIAP